MHNNEALNRKKVCKNAVGTCKTAEVILMLIMLILDAYKTADEVILMLLILMLMLFKSILIMKACKNAVVRLLMLS